MDNLKSAGKQARRSAWEGIKQKPKKALALGAGIFAGSAYLYNLFNTEPSVESQIEKLRNAQNLKVSTEEEVKRDTGGAAPQFQTQGAAQQPQQPSIGSLIPRQEGGEPIVFERQYENIEDLRKQQKAEEEERKRERERAQNRYSDAIDRINFQLREDIDYLEEEYDLALRSQRARQARSGALGTVFGEAQDNQIKQSLRRAIDSEQQQGNLEKRRAYNTYLSEVEKSDNRIDKRIKELQEQIDDEVEFITKARTEVGKEIKTRAANLIVAGMLNQDQDLFYQAIDDLNSRKLGQERLSTQEVDTLIREAYEESAIKLVQKNKKFVEEGELGSLIEKIEKYEGVTGIQKAEVRRLAREEGEAAAQAYANKIRIESERKRTSLLGFQFDDIPQNDEDLR